MSFISETVPITEEVVDEYRNLIDRCYAPCIATAETFEVLGRICCLASTTSDSKLAHKKYDFAHSSWFAAGLMQVGTEGCAMYPVEQEQINELTALFRDIASYAVSLALSYKSHYVYGGCSYILGYSNASELHTGLVGKVTTWQTFLQQVAKKFDIVTQLVSEIISGSGSSQVTVALVEYMKATKNSMLLLQIQVELCDRFLKLLSLTSVDPVRMASIAVQAYLLAMFNLKIIEEHTEIRLAVLDLMSITSVEVQLRLLSELKEKCEICKRTVKAKAEEYKEKAHKEFHQLLFRRGLII